jgi:hypothetical protein
VPTRKTTPKAPATSRRTTAPRTWLDRLEAHPDQLSLIRGITKDLKQKRADFSLDPTLVLELESYLKDVPLLPKHISALKPAQVKKAQGILATLDAQQTRVAAVMFSTSKVLQLLARLELVVRNALLRAELITERSTKPAVINMIALVCPQLARVQLRWEGMERLSALVNNRLSDSRDSLRLQIKMDDNARWANRGGSA